jgi:hypothetical protein
LAKVRPEYRLSCIYIIDSICRNARTKLGEKDNFTSRFSKNIVSTLEKAFMSPKADHENIKRVVGLWAKNNLFSEETHESLFEVCRTKTGSYPGTPPPSLSNLDRNFHKIYCIKTTNIVLNSIS